MTGRTDELEQFKQEIDLRVLAAEFGYWIDAKASSQSGTVMRDAAGGKIRIAKGTDGHFVYWNAHDTGDAGSCVDFVQRRTDDNLGQVRRRLRPLVGVSSLPASREASGPLPALRPIERDIAAIQRQVDAMRPLDRGRHDYLNNERRLPATLLADARFAGRIRVDDRSNAVFVHVNRSGVCGYELKNAGWTGFSSGGAKGLWASAVRPDDHRLVIAEAAIDALSYAALHGFDRTRFVSLAGQVSPEQVELVRGAIEKMPAGEVVLAMDNDAGGDALVDQFVEVFEMVARQDLAVRPDRPSHRDSDWNDELRAGTALRPSGPAP